MKQKHPDDYLTLTNRGSGLFTTMRPLSLLGVPFGRRMVILEKEGQLMLQSPFIPQPEILEQIQQLGEVTAIVVPTIFHDTFLQEVIQTFPKANYYTVAGAEKHLRDQVSNHPIHALADSHWNDILTPLPLAGMPKVNECLFYHQPSKSLLVSDLFFNIENLDGSWLNLFARMMGFADSPSPSRLFKAMIKDKVAFSNSLEEIAQLDFDQILTSHFNTVNTGGKRVIETIITS